MLRHGAFLDRTPKILFADGLSQSDKQLRVRICFGHIPELRFRFGAEPFGNVRGRVHLEGKLIFRGEPFNEQRKARRIRDPPEDLLPIVSPKIMQRSSGERPFPHDALRLWSIDDLPSLAEFANARKSLAQERLETAPT